jgi:Zn-dependent protease with chaperone function
MARKFTRRRWRRPERMTLEHPPVARRKDIAVPDLLELEPGLAQRRNRRRTALLDGVFAVLVGAELALLLIFVRDWRVLAVVAAAALFLYGASRRADSWIRHAVGAHHVAAERLERLLANVARSAAVPVPEIYVVRGERPNACALGAREPWIVVTTAALEFDDLQLEAMLAHELVHIRDGDTAAASTYALLAGGPDLALRAFGAHAGILAWLSLPVWPVALVLRLTRSSWFPDDREHRADVAAALLTRYPPGMDEALRAATGAQPTGPTLLHPLWFAPPDATRANLIAEM